MTLSIAGGQNQNVINVDEKSNSFEFKENTNRASQSIKNERSLKMNPVKICFKKI